MKKRLLTKTVILFFVILLLFPSSVNALSPTRIVPTNPEFEDTPKLTIVSPVEGEQIFGSKVAVSFIVNNFIFNYDGHLHLWLDQKDPTPDKVQEITKATDFTLEDLPGGSHQLVLELVNPNHASFNPKVIKEVNFVTSQPQQINPSVIPLGVKTQEENKRTADLNIVTILSVTVAFFLLLIGIFAYFVLKAKNR